jgi:ketosteroid isomerase-like protein
MVTSSTERNKDAVRRYLLEGIAGADHKTPISDTTTEGVKTHFPAPSFLKERWAEATEGFMRGRAALIAAIEESHEGGNYISGTTRIEVEGMVAEGDWVAVRFTIAALTSPRKEKYKNYYHHLFRMREGKIDEIWQYVDTLYSSRMLSGLGQREDPA